MSIPPATSTDITTHKVNQDSYLEFDHVFGNCHERGQILKLQDVITSLTPVTSQGRAPAAEEALEVEGDDVENYGPLPFRRFGHEDLEL